MFILANDDDGIGSIFGGNITPPISSSTTNRFSKIVIRIGSQSGSNNENGGVKKIFNCIKNKNL